MKLISFITLFFSLNIAYSQNFFVKYSIPNDGEIDFCELFIKDSISVFQRIVKPTEKSSHDKSFFIKNTQTQISHFSQKILNETFFVSDTVHNMHWELLNDTANILNQTCQSAKARFRGRDYIAYYTTKYPVSDGPWKFGGLPGLILLVKSQDGFVEWRATKIIENYSGSHPKKNIENISFLSWPEFVSKFKTTLNNYSKMVRSNGTLSAGGTIKLKIESIEIFYPELQTGDGITF